MNPSRLIIKICGITSIEDALAAVKAGADWIGLNRWPGSPRFVDEARAREIISAVRILSGNVRIVTLHVDPVIEALRIEVERLRPDLLQVHRDAWTDSAISGVPVLRAFNIATASDLTPLAGWTADPILVDAKVAGLRGGTGQRLDPVLICGFKAEVPSCRWIDARKRHRSGVDDQTFRCRCRFRRRMRAGHQGSGEDG